MTTNTNFTAAGTVTVTLDVQPAAFAMPTVDGGNLDTVISCTGAPCWVAFGTGAVVSGSGSAPGSIMVSPAAPLLLTNNANTLAAAAAKGNGTVSGGVPATVAAAATAFSAITMQRGGTITITRGTSAAGTVF